MSAKMKVRKLLASVAHGITLCTAFGACAAPLRGPEAWLELMGGNVRKDGFCFDVRWNR